MKKIYRLTKTFQFNYVYRNGKSFYRKELTLMVVKNRNNKLKVGFSISKKIGKAHVRNKLKRRLKEIFRERIALLNPSLNYVFIAKEQSGDMEFSDLVVAVDFLLNKAGAYSK